MQADGFFGASGLPPGAVCRAPGKIQEKAGEISNLRIQVPYVLFPSTKAPSGKTYRPCRYIADFVYVDNATGETVVADAKGMKTKEYAVKKKWLLKDWGIEIKEV